MAILPQLVLSAPKRSNFDLAYKTRFTATPGALYPVMVQRCLPGDHFEIDVTHLVKTLAMKAPLMGRMGLQFDFFFCADRHFMPEFRLNNIGLPQFSGATTTDQFGQHSAASLSTDVRFPYFALKGNPENTLVNSPVETRPVAPSSLFDYLGIPVGFVDLHPTTTVASPSVSTQENQAYIYSSQATLFNALPFLHFWDIYVNYYINPQEQSFYYYGAGAANSSYNNYSQPRRFDTKVKNMKVTDLQKWLNNCRNGRYKDILGNPMAYSEDVISSKILDFFKSDISAVNGCLPLRCYRPDYFSNFMSSDNYDKSIAKAGVVFADESGGIRVTQLRYANKLQRLAERAVIAGNRYGEWIRAMFGVDTDDTLDIPEFLGSFRNYMSFQDIVNQSGSNPVGTSPEDSSTHLGGSAGRGISSDKSRKFYVNASEYGYIFCMFSIVPEPDYYQGVRKELTKTFLSDEFNPQLDRLGFQAIYASEYYALPAGDGLAAQPWMSDTVDPFNDAVAYQPAWLEYMTRTNELHGNFATDLDFWTLGRTFNRDDSGTGVADDANLVYSAYIFPNDYAIPFVDQSPSAQNFLVQLAFDVFAKRPISKKLMPNLG